MKKSLLAVAVAAALPGFAFAQSNVTLFGVADVSANFSSRGGKDAAGNSVSTNFQVMSGVGSTSRLGVRGEEDLGGGQKAIFWLEGNTRYDTGEGNGTSGAFNWTRRAFAGIQGNYGTFRMGRDYTPAFWSGLATDTNGYGMWGTTLAFASYGMATATGAYRASNALFYESPSMSGFSLRAMYGSGERDTDPKSYGNVFSFAGFYNAGPLAITGYYQGNRALPNTISTTQNTTPGSSPAVTPIPNAGITTTQNLNQYGLGGSYNFGKWRLAGGWGHQQNPLDNSDTDMFNIGGGVALGTGELSGQYIYFKTKNPLGGTDPRSDTYSLTYRYPMSKRTDLYASGGYTHNNVNGLFGLAGSDVAITPAKAGENVWAFGVGMRHHF